MKQVKQILSQLIGTQNILSNNILFIDFTGSHEKAQYLSQLFYWSSRTKRKDGFFAKKYDDWYLEIRIKKHSLRRYTKEFIELGFLETKFEKFNGVPTLHYRLDQDILIKELVTFCEGNNEQGLQIVTLEGNTKSPSMEGNTKSPSINIDYTDTTNIEREPIDQKENKDIHLKPTEKLKEPPKQPELQLDWKPAANEIITDKDALIQIKDQSGYRDNIREFCKAYFLNLVSKGEWFRLTVPADPGEKYKWRAKHIAGITSWIIRDKKFYPNRNKRKDDTEKLAPYHKNMFDYSIIKD